MIFLHFRQVFRPSLLNMRPTLVAASLCFTGFKTFILSIKVIFFPQSSWLSCSKRCWFLGHYEKSMYVWWAEEQQLARAEVFVITGLSLDRKTNKTMRALVPYPMQIKYQGIVSHWEVDAMVIFILHLANHVLGAISLSPHVYFNVTVISLHSHFHFFSIDWPYCHRDCFCSAPKLIHNTEGMSWLHPQQD